MGKNFRDTLKHELKNPEFQKEYLATRAHTDLILAMLEARERLHLTQNDISALTGISQADISRIENGNANPSLKTIAKLAEAFGMCVRLQFVPIEDDLKEALG